MQVTEVGTSIRCRDGSIPPCKTVMIAVEQIRNEAGLLNYFLIRSKTNHKERRVLPMVIWSEIRMGQ